MTDAAAWSRAADPARRVGRAVEFHASIGSTNDRARAALAEGADGLAIVADEQTQGRGRRGRSWLTPPGMNLAVSVGLRLGLDPSRSGLLGVAAALAARDACDAMLPAPRLAIRWPNDIVNPDGRKVAGLLIETTLTQREVDEAVIGIGVNVNWRRDAMPAEIRPLATSLADEAGRDLDRVTLLSVLLDRLDAELAELDRGDEPIARFREASALDGRVVTVDLGASRIEGRVLGIAADGSLRVESGGQAIDLSMGEVVSVRDGQREVAV